MRQAKKYSPEVRERAVRMVFEHEAEYASQWAAIQSIAEKIGCSYRASDFPGHLTGVSWWGPEDRRSGDGELNVVG